MLHWSTIAVTSVASTLASAQSTLFFYDEASGALASARADGIAASWTPIGPTGAALEALDFDLGGGALWCVADLQGTATTGVLDVHSGHFFPRAAGLPFASASDVAAGPDGALWYVVEAMGPDARVWTGSLPQGSFLSLATVANLGASPAMAVDPLGRVVLYGGATGRLVTLDPTTGAVTSDVTGPVLGAARGMDFDWATGELLAVLETASSASLFVRLDPSTAAPTVLEDLGAGGARLRGAVRRSGRRVPTTSFCTPAVPNVTGAAGRITAQGSAHIEQDDFVLHAGVLPPHTFGLFLASLDAAPPAVPPGSVGRLCLGGAIGRIGGGAGLLPTGAGGTFSKALALGAMPQPGGLTAVGGWESWHFQAWYRDSFGGAATSNFTGAIRVDFHDTFEGPPFGPRGLPIGRGGLLATADVDADGRLDVLSFDPFSGRVDVLLGRPDGGFEAAPPVSGLPHGYGFAVADVDGDGDVDFAVHHAAGYRIVIVEQVAQGTFVEAATYQTCPEVQHVRLVDLDDDAAPDLLLSCDAHGWAEVRFNDGSGGFGAPLHLDVGLDPREVHAADLDGDGLLDLVSSSSSTAGVAVLRQVSARTFAAAVPYATSAPADDATLGDVDGDGALDVALAHAATSAVSILHGDGAGAFSPAALLPVAPPPTRLAIADLDRDGRADVALAHGQRASLGWLRGVAGGSLVAGADVLHAPFVRDFIVTDVDADGIAELITEIDLPMVTVLDASISQLARPVVETVLPGAPGQGSPYYAGVAALGDVTGDGRADLVYQGPALGLRLAPGLGDGSFGASSLIGPGANDQIELADFDGDGDLDVVRLTPWTLARFISVFWNDGAGVFVAGPEVSFTVSITRFALGDVDQDGDLDIVTSAMQRGITVVRNDGAGGLLAAEYHNAPTWLSAVRVGDLDADGRLDVIANVAQIGGLVACYGLGGGAFGPLQPIDPRFAHDPHVGDFDGDGLLDIVALTETSPNGRITLFQNLGQRRFATLDGPLLSRSRRLFSVDLDGDGVQEVVREPTDAVGLGLHRFTGGTHALEERFWVSSTQGISALGDVDGDGARDVVIVSYERPSILVALDAAH